MRTAPRTWMVLALGAAACAPSHEMEVRPPVGACADADRPEIAWTRPASNGEQEKLDGWCDSTGGPVVVRAAKNRTDPEPEASAGVGGGRPVRGAGSPVASFPVEIPADSLLVGTWNIEVGTGELTRLLEERLGHVCGVPGGGPAPARARDAVPFVLLVQEAHRESAALPPVPDGVPLPGRIEKSAEGGARADIVATARACGLELIYVPSMRNGAESAEEIPEDRGNAILASVPLSDFEAIELPLETQRRVAVAALAHPPGREPVRVVSFHLDVAASLLRVLTTGNATRLRQGLGLAEAIDRMEAGDRPRPTVIGGDVNTWAETETVIRHLVERFPASPTPTDEPTRGAFPTDHLFVRTPEGSGVSAPEETYRVVPDTYSSDHRARFLTLRFGAVLPTARSAE